MQLRSSTTLGISHIIRSSCTNVLSTRNTCGWLLASMHLRNKNVHSAMYAANRLNRPESYSPNVQSGSNISKIAGTLEIVEYQDF